MHVLIRLLGGISCLEGVTFSPCSDDYPSQFQYLGPWEETPSHAPTPGYYSRERTPSVFSISSDHVLEGRSSPSYQGPSNQLGFQDDEPGNGRTNNRRSPGCVVQAHPVAMMASIAGKTLWGKTLQIENPSSKKSDQVRREWW
ncbi:hypothetical protein ASPCADRAFT_211964 [Aspergillus carbonarius ITEM 5010]|uniref:Uncharacterized protein n=1 Tax=Aspergillus carbonarius (strain ITEM 5010) TaxID=602072 RepID=A0A1R3R7Q7_ASPC5|nr:hypothetical protein ASPCADRAFT_211964 [Aspergillus carbonarius ITEM 5010]